MKNIDKILYRADMSEKSIEAYLRTRIKSLGGICLKIASPTESGYPDRLCVLPYGVTAWVELKSLGETPRKLQRLRLDQLRALDQLVFVCDSKEKVDEALGILTDLCGYKRKYL